MEQLSTTTTETLTTPSPRDSHHAPPMFTLSFDLVQEILCRLPVRSLMQFQCVCKSWKLLNSDDYIFAKKHLHMSLAFPRQSRHHLMVNSSRGNGSYWNSPISNVFNVVSNTHIMQTKLRYPPILKVGQFVVVGSCHDIICVRIPHYVVFWNPSMGKFKISPVLHDSNITYGFGYDHYNDNYKVVAISRHDFGKTEVEVLTLGTNNWRRIQEFPCGVPVGRSGKFIRGVVHWVASKDGREFNSSYFVVSLKLGNESYQEILQPDYRDANIVCLTLGELRDCLCIFAHVKSFVDVWVLKECGKKESWNKLFTIPFIDDHLCLYPCNKASYIYEDEQVFKSVLFVICC